MYFFMVSKVNAFCSFNNRAPDNMTNKGTPSRERLSAIFPNVKSNDGIGEFVT